VADVEQFVGTLGEELGGIFSTVGVNDSMAHFFLAAGRCWDWPRLVVERPTVDDVRAVRSLAASLRPCLQHTLMPRRVGDFSAVEDRWPEDDELCIQYVMLCSRVRRALSDPGVPQSVKDCTATWVERGTTEVRVLRAARVVRLTVGRVWGQLWGILPAAVGVDRVSQFLVGEGQRRLISRSELSAVRRHRVRGKCADDMSPLVPGTLMRVRSSGSPLVAGCLVEVARSLRNVSAAEVAAALDTNSWFGARPDQSSGRTCWAIVRLHHRCRLLMAPDAACESVGSFMRLLWNSRRTSGDVAARIGDCAVLAAAGVSCVGSARDEALVRNVVETLRATSVQNPRKWSAPSSYVAELVSKGSTPGSFTGVPGPLAGIATVRKRREALTAYMTARSAEELPAQMSKSIGSSGDAAGRTRPLPLTVRHLHARQRGATSSAERPHQQEWLEQHRDEQAWLDRHPKKQAHREKVADRNRQAQWAAERATLLQADDPGSDTGSDEGEPAAKARRAS
jgi:hypothetical protein